MGDLTRWRHAGLGVVCTAAALVAMGTSPAAAGPRRGFKILKYKVTYEGSGSYSVKQQDGPSHGEVTAHFHWNATYRLTFIDKAGEQVGGIADSASSGGGDWSISSDNGGGEVCSESGGLKLNKYGAIQGAVQPSGKVDMKLTPGNQDYATTGGSSGSQACDTTDFWHDWVESFSHVGTDESVDPLTAFANLSARELRAGKVIINASNNTLAAPSLQPDPDCGSGNGATCHQSFDWKGSVTFRKTGSQTVR